MRSAFTVAYIALAGLAMSLGYGSAQPPASALIPLTLALAWFLAYRQGWMWSGGTGLAVFTLMAAAGILLQVHFGWSLLTVLAALGAWDLMGLTSRGMQVGQRLHSTELDSAHLRRLWAVQLLGASLAPASLLIDLQLGFLAALFLALLAIYALSRALRTLARQS
jgi:hypothetical protein